ncbi:MULTISPECIES: cation-translocating P-type ATPase [unclassified Francisella]|uniref:cation-translocating P-type ATPase n=1 Tax=unclassified Francisella TaxID=2610885 RepID=UPI002E359982|nr:MULTISPECIES: HAD-IC family P-type ATPase [unclassified Francisella]MED7820401.1 HAD-IC family P-type ATPase [Francisella sp. 19S2-4]MED7831236.1 HAD-IC family P-type ATPase [Francisella sp. 19S2-10]
MLGLALFTLIVGIYRGEDIFYMLKAIVALAVSAIPEGLPAAITATLAIGVSRMAKKNAIVRKLPVVETLGSATVICSDKTGTLTQNQMTVKKIWTNNGFYEVSGQGYYAEGSIIKNDHIFSVSKDNALEECLINGILCNDSSYDIENEEPVYEGDPTEICLYLSAIKAGLNYKDIMSKSIKIDTLPFESERQYMATLFKRDNGLNRIYIKGAIERVFSISDNILNKDGSLEAIDREKLLNYYKEASSQGMRILTFAYKDTFNESILDEDMQDGFIFVGFQSIIDPPRPGVIESIKRCHSAGIVVKMITGDHVLTAQAIASQLGIINETYSEVLSGEQLEKLNDNDLAQQLKETNVFARVTPTQKLRIVKLLQQQNNIVAMTGDGVNDAPALKRADIGIAMGITGTEVSKDAADMILTDDNFATIELAVKEGRGIFDNITKFITWTLPTNLGEGLIILIAIFLGVTLPVTPIQILWINMTTAVFLGLMLAFEPKEHDIMNRKPNSPNIAILNQSLIIKIIIVGLILVGSSFLLFWYELFVKNTTIEQARTVATTVFIVVEAMYLLNSRSIDKSVFEIGLFSNKYIWIGIILMLILQLCFIYLPIMNMAFETSPISLKDC